MTNDMSKKTTTDRVVEETKDVAEQAQKKVDEVATTVKKQTKEMADQASDQARSMAATRKEAVVYELEGVAHALRGVGDQLSDQDQGNLARSIELYRQAREAYANCSAQGQISPYDDILTQKIIGAACAPYDQASQEALAVLEGEQ